mgnify:CR=1 FL=1
MKIKNVLFIFLLLIISNNLRAQEIARVVQIVIDSKILNQKRPVLIYTPKNYDETNLVSYEVIYVFDSQNREHFDLVHSSLSYLSKNKFIVVGIVSPYYEETDYARNNDYSFTPKNINKQELFNGYCCNAEKLLDYTENEVVKYIDSNYRTLPKRVAIGHSLSASFILQTLILKNNLFDSFIAISPNLAIDKQDIIQEYKKFDFSKQKENKFLYISNADEGKEYWQEWLPARQKFYEFLQSPSIQNKLKVEIEDLSTNDHWSVYMPSIIKSLKLYSDYSIKQPEKIYDKEYDITIRVKVPDNKDQVYITGNQLSLGEWNPSKVKMKNLKNNEREIKIKVNSLTKIQFTRGNWDTKAFVKNNNEFEDIIIDPIKHNLYEFEIQYWMDKQ